MGIVNKKLTPKPQSKPKGKRYFKIMFTPDDPRKRFEASKGGDVTNLEILQGLEILQKHYAKAVIEDYERETGNTDADEKGLNEWLKKNQYQY